MSIINNLSLEKVLFYLSILIFENSEITKLSLDNVSIKIYGSIIKGVNKESLIYDLNKKLNSLFQDHVFREELSFGFTPEKYNSINPKYYGKTVKYFLNKSDNKISLIKVSF
ncbi:hypothetical protein ACHRV1_02530 [Flavobacterium aquidurense]|uniref:hypothetical protein n=1 Tax=Flavobacterium aquidurense TaxID=362413 RepID=UPI0037571827